MDLALTTRPMGDKVIIEVGGEIDVYTAPRLREHLVSVVAQGHHHLIIDMEGVGFLDSTGIGVLVSGLRRVREHNGTLRLVCSQPHVLKILRITGLTTVFPIDESMDAALRAEAVHV